MMAKSIVLILVVVEDSLWRCFFRIVVRHLKVLILVVVEDSLWLANNKLNGKYNLAQVLILVVVEDSLWPGLLDSLGYRARRS